MIRDQVVAYMMSSQSSEDWSIRLKHVWAQFDNLPPDFWMDAVMNAGVHDRCLERWLSLPPNTIIRPVDLKMELNRLLDGECSTPFILISSKALLSPTMPLLTGLLKQITTPPPVVYLRLGHVDGDEYYVEAVDTITKERVDIYSGPSWDEAFAFAKERCAEKGILVEEQEP